MSSLFAKYLLKLMKFALVHALNTTTQQKYKIFTNYLNKKLIIQNEDITFGHYCVLYAKNEYKKLSW